MMRAQANPGMDVWGRAFTDAKAGDLVRVSLEEIKPAADGGPAFPVLPVPPSGPVPSYDGSHPFSMSGITDVGMQGHPGMSLRDYFASQTVAVILGLRPDESMPEVAAAAYDMADAMLEARKR